MNGAAPSRRAALALAVRIAVGCAVVLVSIASAGCAGEQSALDPSGRDAERVASLFWGMTAGAVVVWLAVTALAVYAASYARGGMSALAARRLIVAGGVVVPTVVLAALLAWGLATLPVLLAPAPEGSLRVHVVGEQWWWRVRYLRPDGDAVDLANEIRLPVGAPVEFQLESADVIHSFWIPALGGKVDMIPGHRTRLRLEPTRTGRFRGVCAEYCGTSHALMAFPVVVHEEEEFIGWLARQAAPAASPTDPLAVRGGELFLADGCGACHAVRGTAADGVVGPDLTHVGSRLSIGAGTLANEPADIVNWLSRTAELKPGVHMPSFGMLEQDDLRALAAYLGSLR